MQENTTQRAENKRAADEAVAQAVRALDASDAPIGVYTDASSVPGWVIVAIARRGSAAAAIVVPTREYDGMAVIRIIDPALADGLARPMTA